MVEQKKKEEELEKTESESGSEPLLEEEPPPEPKVEDGPKEESPRETARRVLEETKKAEGLSKDKKEQPKGKEGGEAKQKEEKQEQVKQPQEVKTPSRFNAEERIAFEKLDPGMKQAVSRMVTDHQRKMTETTQKASQAEQNAKHLVETVRPYLHSRPHLMEAGYTEAGLVQGLIAVHEKLENPKTKVQEWLKIGQQSKIPGIEKVAELVSQQNGNTAQQAPAADPALHNKINQLESYIRQQQQSQTEAVVSQQVREIEAVRNERDATGNFKFPELYEDAFLDRVRPLANAYLETGTARTLGQAVKLAHSALTGKPFQAGSQAGPSNEQEQTQKQQAPAPKSLRGQPQQGGNPLNSMEIPEEALANPRASAAWALEQLRRGG